MQLVAPPSAIGKTTVESIGSGYSWVGRLIDGLIERFQLKLERCDSRGDGAWPEWWRHIQTPAHRQELTLEGLRLAYERIRKSGACLWEWRGDGFR